MVLVLFITIICLFFLIKGAEWLIQGAVPMAERLKVSKLIIATTLIAFGTGLPTIAVNIAMVLSGTKEAEVAVGNALGTNWVNIGLALGIPALITTIKTKYTVFEKEIPIFLALTGLYTSFALDSVITRLEGVIILLSYIFTILIIYQYAKRERVNALDKQLDLDTSTLQTTPTENISPRKALLLIITGLSFLSIFSIVLTKMASPLAEIFHVSEYVIGLTIIGIGTSLPTIVTSIRSAKNGYIDIILGNVFGGTIANIGVGLGLPAIIRNLSFDSEAISDTYYFNILNIVVLFGILVEMKLLKKENNVLNQLSGLIMISVYLIYLVSKFV